LASSDWLNDPLPRFIDSVAEQTPAPGGGSTAAVALAMAAALVEMAAQFARDWDGAADAVAQARSLRERVLPLAWADADAYAAVLGADDAVAHRAALDDASLVPLQLAEAGSAVAELGAAVAEAGAPSLRGDASAGAVLGAAAARAAATLVAINLAASPNDERVSRAEAAATRAATEAERAAAAAARGVEVEPQPLYVWITTRQIKPGTYEEFSRAWRPETIPEGMLEAFEYYAEDLNEVVGLSLWTSPEARDQFRLSDVEARRRQAMAPYVVHEHSGFYLGRALKLPRRTAE
jgi:formiminotetrahydrofolate cyclodeaminase